MKKTKCPNCNHTSNFVKYETVKYLAKDVISVSKDSDYYLCSNNDCDVVYFNDDQNLYTIDIDIFHLGESDNDESVCWCSSVTKGDIEREINDRSIKTIKDIIKYVSRVDISECTNERKSVCYSSEIKHLLNLLD